MSPVASEPVIALDPDWPRLSLAQARAALTAQGSRFEMETIPIRGVPTRVWKHAPPSLPALVEAARGHGDRLFVIYEDERVSYEAAARAIAALAAHFRALGVAKGDRVALAMRNLPEWPVAFFAATAIGAIAVPLNAWWTGAELAFGLTDSGAKVLIVDDERHARLASRYRDLPALAQVIVARSAEVDGMAIRLEQVIGAAAGWASLPAVPIPTVPIAPDDDATIFYTSGTTGRPKGALGTHRNLMSNILSGGYAAARSLLRRGEAVPPPSPRTVLTVIPLFHVTACSAG